MSGCMWHCVSAMVRLLTWQRAQAAAASAQHQMEQVALLPQMMAMAHVLAAKDAQQRQALYAPPPPQPGTLPECAPLVTADAQLAVVQQQQQHQKQQCAEQLMALLAAGKPVEGPSALWQAVQCTASLLCSPPSYQLDDGAEHEGRCLQEIKLERRATSVQTR